MKHKMQVIYDRVSDVLYLSVGKPRKAISHDAGNGILLRIDPQTDSIIGLTVFNLSARDDLGALVIEVEG